jgi:hypothetical protein
LAGLTTVEHATNVDELRNKYGLTADTIVAKVKADSLARPLRRCI